MAGPVTHCRPLAMSVTDSYDGHNALLEAGGAVTPWIGGYSDYRGADDPLPALRP